MSMRLVQHHLDLIRLGQLLEQEGVTIQIEETLFDGPQMVIYSRGYRTPVLTNSLSNLDNLGETEKTDAFSRRR